LSSKHQNKYVSSLKKIDENIQLGMFFSLKTKMHKNDVSILIRFIVVSENLSYLIVCFLLLVVALENLRNSPKIGSILCTLSPLLRANYLASQKSELY